jgi:hypothetical protein
MGRNWGIQSSRFWTRFLASYRISSRIRQIGPLSFLKIPSVRIRAR